MGKLVIGPTPERSEGVQRLLAVALARTGRGLGGTELIKELALGGAFLVAAVVLAVVPSGSVAIDLDDAVLVFIGLVLASRVVFEVGSGYTMPVQLAFVPALFILPPELAPLFVVCALVVARSIDVAQGSLHPSRILNAFADSWFSIGPAVVIVLAGSPAADSASAAVLVIALASQFACDAMAARVREWMHGGAPLRDQLRESAWIYFVDALLSPVGLAIAIAATSEPIAVALSWPMYLLLATFARERDERLASLLELSEAYRGTARVLGEVVEHDDTYTGLHIRGVAELAVEIAADLRLDPGRRRLVEFGALLHDVGKIAIPNAIINKAGPLDEPEWRVIRTHTVEGQRMLEGIGGLMSSVGRIVRWSHERYDGDGYPDGLSGDEIPIESRIVFACDAYHAMTTDRVYRPALAHADALRELQANAGTQFDPRVVEVMVRRLGPIPPDRDPDAALDEYSRSLPG